MEVSDYYKQRYAQNRADLDAYWRARSRGGATETTPQPVKMDARSGNVLRPHTFDQIVGQEAAKRLMRAAVASSRAQNVALEHTLLTGSAGTGKTTFANVIGNELGVDVYQLAAPVSFDTLLSLREAMRDRDILFVDEIHQQAILERRGKESTTQPEVFLAMMEDRVILAPNGPLPYPEITVVGATTDPGRLPEAFLSRFPLNPRLADYSDADLAVIAIRNAQALGLNPDKDGAIAVALAAGGVPRQVNNLVRQARMFGAMLDKATVLKVLEATGITEDGLTPEQQAMITFLRRFGEQRVHDETIYQSSVGSIAVAIGLSRDVKAVQLYVEPALIKRGLVQVRPSGRRLTAAGVKRAEALHV